MAWTLQLAFQALWHSPMVSLLHSITHHTCDKLDVTLCPACTPLHSGKKELLAIEFLPAQSHPGTHCLKTPGLRLSPTHGLGQP